MPTEFDKWRDQKIIEIADEVAEIRAIGGELTRLRAVNAELLSCLKAIVHEYDNTYDASIEPGDSHWTAAASIPVEVMQRAERVIKKHGGLK